MTSSVNAVRFLSQMQRKCVFPDEGPSYVECERKKIKFIMRSTCNCLPWFYAENETEECLMPGYKCISNIRPAEVIHFFE